MREWYFRRELFNRDILHRLPLRPDDGPRDSEGFIRSSFAWRAISRVDRSTRYLRGGACTARSFLPARYQTRVDSLMPAIVPGLTVYIGHSRARRARWTVVIQNKSTRFRDMQAQGEGVAPERYLRRRPKSLPIFTVNAPAY